MSWSQRLAYIFTSALGATILLYLLRGFQILKIFPGGLILILAVVAIASGLLYGVLKTKR
jgi:hypothetical protein